MNVAGCRDFACLRPLVGRRRASLWWRGARRCGWPTLVWLVGDLRPGRFFFLCAADRNILFWTRSTQTFSSGRVTQVSNAPITAGQLMTNGPATQDWVGTAWEGYTAHVFRMRISLDGAWTLWMGSQAVASGRLSVVSWPDRSAIVRLGVASNVSVQLAAPFSSFLMQVGLSGNPLVSFVRQ